VQINGKVRAFPMPEMKEANRALQLKVRDVILESLTAKRSQDLINAAG
jgi:hypothetical protein